MKVVIGVLCALIAFSTAGAQTRPVHTYSIVARDPATGELGVAVQSHWFCVGLHRCLGRAGRRRRRDAVVRRSELRAARVGADAGREERAGCVARTVDERPGARGASGGVRRCGRTRRRLDRSQGHTGGRTAAGESTAASHAGAIDGGTFSAGSGFSVQANLMLNDRVWPAMAKAFQESKGDLAERMLHGARSRAGGGRRHPRPAVRRADRRVGQARRQAVGVARSTCVSTITRSR